MSEAASEIPTVGIGLCWEETPVGFRFKTLGRTITETDITNFVCITGMLEVLFTDLEYLRNESLYSGRLAPGVLVYSFAEGLLMQTVVQRTGLAFLGTDMEVHKPSFAGDTIRVECEVLESRPSRKPGRGFVKTRNKILNQKGELVMTYSPSRLVKGLDFAEHRHA